MIAHDSVVGRSYRLVERLGAGELGQVWRARHEKMGREVAIKFLQPAWKVEPRHIEAFLKDARASGRLQHPNIIELLDQGEHEGVAYVVMPLLDAEKLEALLERRGRLSLGHATKLASDLAQGVAAAHEQRVFHLRIESANVLLHRDTAKDGSVRMTPKLIDFGIARLGDGPLISPLPYLAPEQLQGETGDGRADVWAFTTLLAHMLLGRLPFEDASAKSLLEHLDVLLASALQELERIDPQVAAVARDGWQRDKAKRPLLKVFARRLRDLSLRTPATLDDLSPILVIPESLAPSALESVPPPPPKMPPPRPPSIPRMSKPTS